MNPLFSMGSSSLQFLEYVGGLSLLAFQTLAQSVDASVCLRTLLRQMDQIGVKSASIAGVAALFTGLVLALQTTYGLARFGAKGFVAAAVALSMVRELGPVLTALLVGGRVGSGFTAELGSMKVTEQLDAMRAIGASVIRELVVPRVTTTMLVLPLLTILADVVGILGGMAISSYEFQGDFHLYLHTVITTVKVADLLNGLGKSLVFGFLIAVIGCYHGLEASGGAEGLGRATTGTVVASALAVLISDFFLTKLFWYLGG